MSKLLAKVFHVIFIYKEYNNHLHCFSLINSYIHNHLYLLNIKIHQHCKLGSQYFPQETLRTAMAMGCDRSIHVIVDPKDYETMQPLHVAKIISKIVEEEKFDVVLTGKQVKLLHRVLELRGPPFAKLPFECQKLFTKKIVFFPHPKK